MSFGDAISTCFSKYVTFSGTASRSEFWWFYLFTVIVTFAVVIILAFVNPDGLQTNLMIQNLVSIDLSIPVIAAGTRRLHEIGKSGWWQLIVLTGIGAILLIVWWCKEGNQSTQQ